MTNKGKKEMSYKLTKDIDCSWCGAEAGEPCKIQIPIEEQELTHRTYKLGSEFLEEKVHLIRSISNA